MRKLFKVIGLVASTSFVVMSSPVFAENFDDVFASSVIIKQLNKARDYEVKFARTKNSYSYQIQLAGKNVIGGLACTRFAAKQVDSLEWKKVKSELGINIGINNENVNGTINANLYSDGEYVTIYGGKIEFYERARYVAQALHIRVVAINGKGEEVYKTNWEGGNDIKNWGWTGDCAWVAQ